MFDTFRFGFSGHTSVYQCKHIGSREPESRMGNHYGSFRGYEVVHAISESPSDDLSTKYLVVIHLLLPP